MSEKETDREEVCKLALKWGIKVNKYRTTESLVEQVNWRLACRSIIKKWDRCPTDVVSTILVFVGNESEMKSVATEKKLKVSEKVNL